MHAAISCAEIGMFEGVIELVFVVFSYMKYERA